MSDNPPVNAVRFEVDSSALDAVIAELASLPKPFVAELAHRSGYVAEEMFDIRPDDRAAATAGVVRLALQPSERLLGFLAAARAGNVEGLIVERALGHPEFLSSGGVVTADDSRVGGGGPQAAASGSEGGAA